jgi:sulfopyruvate decarboxylase TPP-binding subunit
MNNELHSAGPGPGTIAPAGADIIAAMKAAGVRHVIAVPDIVTSNGILFPLARDPEVRLVRVCKEDEGVGICAGLSYSGQRAILLMQHTGLLDSVNAVRAVAVEYALPIVMMVGLLEKEPGVPPAQSRRYGVRIVEPILDAMGIGHVLIETQADVGRVQGAIEAAYAQSQPVVVLFGRRPTA